MNPNRNSTEGTATFQRGTGSFCGTQRPQQQRQQHKITKSRRQTTAMARGSAKKVSRYKSRWVVARSTAARSAVESRTGSEWLWVAWTPKAACAPTSATGCKSWKKSPGVAWATVALKKMSRAPQTCRVVADAIGHAGVHCMEGNKPENHT